MNASPAFATDPAHHGVIDATEAAALAQQRGLSLAGLASALVPWAQKYAAAPVSGFQVGAVGVGASGVLYYGANLEIPGQALGVTVHAEQSCVANAWRNGETGLAALAVSAAPCGFCRQFLFELDSAENLEIVLPGKKPRRLADLLPDAFGPRDLGVAGGLMQPQDHGLVVGESMNETGHCALAAANASYSPYTKSFAGVALRTATGQICTGRYAENAAFNPSLSPLEAALSQLVLRGEPFSAITEAVLVQAPGMALQMGAAQTVLETIGNVPLTIYYATTPP